MQTPDINFIWWKEICVGPFSTEQLGRLNMERIEILVDALLEQEGHPRTPPFSEAMKKDPDVPHIFCLLNETK